MSLTDTEVRKSKPTEKAYRLSDGGSLYLWVTPAGGKLWRWAYNHDGKEKLMSFGKYPDVPLALARERHTEARRLLAVGTDPMAQRTSFLPGPATQAPIPARTHTPPSTSPPLWMCTTALPRLTSLSPTSATREYCPCFWSSPMTVTSRSP